MYLLDEDAEQGDQIETLHIYVYPEEPRQPRWPLSLETKNRLLSIGTIAFLLCGVIALCLIPNEPAYATQTVSVPAHFLPLVKFSTTSAIIPTGSKTYPATYAQGTLTIYNGSILTQALPAGFIVTSKHGVEIVTDSSVTIPPANPPSYGTATVSAHAVSLGSAGNIAAYGVNVVYGADVYIKNLSAFAGGQDARTETYATPGDIQNALVSARATLGAQEHQHSGLLASPCQEKVEQKALVLTVSWACQFVNFTPPSGAEVLSARVVGSYVLLRVKVVMVSSPRGFPVK